jgi:integrase/recombinase XerD
MFLHALKAERALARNSELAYRNDLEQFLLLCPAIQEATTDDIRTFLGELKDYSPRSVARKLSALRQFFAFCVAEKIRPDNPMLSISAPKQGRSLPKVLSVEQVDTLLATAALDATPEGLRLLAFLEILYASGLRVSELVTLKLVQLHKRGDSFEPFLTIKGKGGKERLVPLHQAALRAIQKYMEVRGSFIRGSKESPWLFPSASAEGHLTRQRLGQLLKELALKANLDPTCLSPHVLRHCFASHLLHRGADLRIVQQLLGHSSITTTEIYTHVQQEQLKALLLEHHPLGAI